MVMERARRQVKVLAQAMVRGTSEDRSLRQSEKEVSTYLPRPQATALLIDEVKATAHDHPDVYLSTPITGGARLVEFLKERHKRGKDELNREELKEYGARVIRHNCEHAHEVAERLRSSGKSVVEPSRISMPGWSQTSYNQNWTAVVNGLPIQEVQVCDGWQLSFGCLVEVRTAFDRGIAVTDEHGRTLTPKMAKQEVKAAVAEARKAGIDLPLLSRVLTAPTKTLPMEM